MNKPIKSQHLWTKKSLRKKEISTSCSSRAADFCGLENRLADVKEPREDRGPCCHLGWVCSPPPSRTGPSHVFDLAFCLRVCKETRLLKSLPHCHCGFVRLVLTMPGTFTSSAATFIHLSSGLGLIPQNSQPQAPQVFKPSWTWTIDPGPLWTQRPFEARSKITMICALRLCWI